MNRSSKTDNTNSKDKGFFVFFGETAVNSFTYQLKPFAMAGGSFFNA